LIQGKKRVTTVVDVSTKLAQVGVETNDAGALVDPYGLIRAPTMLCSSSRSPRPAVPGAEGQLALGDYLKGISGRMRLEGVSSLEIHETVKPEVAIIEMTMTGTVTATGAPYQQSYVVVLTVRDGLIVRYRDYRNPLRVAE
jgi:uncharacterized protein